MNSPNLFPPNIPQNSNTMYWVSISVFFIIIVGIAIWFVTTTTQTPDPIPDSAPVPGPSSTDAWCFVGEDFTGRWCVQVPIKSACDADRTYDTRHDCELVNAHHLPAGILTNNGATMAPLSKMLRTTPA